MNITEKAIQVFKYTYFAVLYGTDVSFPLQLWCQILYHIEYQLNMLNEYRIVPSASVFAHMCGQHDYDAHSVAPLGSTVEMYVTPKNHRTWDSHIKKGCYLDVSWENYRCHQVWISETKSRRIGRLYC
jgi:hypothetical protein